MKKPFLSQTLDLAKYSIGIVTIFNLINIFGKLRRKKGKKDSDKT